MKLTKKQEKALKSLLLDLDELENKPRRLFHALEEFAFAFEKEDCVPSIREAQDKYYDFWDKGEFLKDIVHTLKKFKIKTWRHQIDNNGSLENAQQRINGAFEYSEELAKTILID